MSTSGRIRRWIALSAPLWALVAGCETPAGPQFQWWSTHRVADEEGGEHRSRFQQNGDPESFRWLLAHHVKPGMSLSEVGEALGSAGERVWDDTRFKTGEGRYFQTDETYRWGPDSGGSSAYLIFREGKLVNYDPRQYRKG